MRCYNCMRDIPMEKADFCPYCGKNPSENNPPHRLAAGTVLHDRYLIGATLGEGGFGITYVGFDQTLYIKVAVKEYYPSGIATRFNTISNDVRVSAERQQEAFERGKESFLREARSVAQFSKERGVVDVRDFFTENNTAYIVMEYLDGVNLNEYIAQKGIMDAQHTFKIMLPLMRSLEKMHRQNIIHRDISPDNIMMQPDGTLKLMDFGAARQFSRDESKSLSVVLKPGFAPFEQYSRKGKQGSWTDVYALCATIYACITGKAPSDSLDRSVTDDLKKPSELGIPIPQNLENALIKGLAVHQQDRLQSMGELIAAIEEEPMPAVTPILKKPEAKEEENPTIAADDDEKDGNKTVVADDSETDGNKTVAADDLDNEGQKTISADKPVIIPKPLIKPEKHDEPVTPPAKEKKKSKKVPIIIISVVLAIAIAVGAVIFVPKIIKANKENELKNMLTAHKWYNQYGKNCKNMVFKPDGTFSVIKSIYDEADNVGEWNGKWSILNDELTIIVDDYNGEDDEIFLSKGRKYVSYFKYVDDSYVKEESSFEKDEWYVSDKYFVFNELYYSAR